MCDRYSWIEKNGNVLFLTPYDVFETKRGKALQKHTPYSEDWYGHGAIRWFYRIEGGVDRECTDFGTPANFPPELVDAIKAGKMLGFGVTDRMLVMLTPAARAEYDKVRVAALAEYDKVRDAAWAEYDKVCDAAWAEYDKVCDAAWAKLFTNPKNRITTWR